MPAKHTKTLQVAYRRIEELTPCPHNARTHSKAQIRKIAESIRAFGFTNPALINSDDMIIAAHGRVEAAKIVGLEQVPTIRLESLTPSQIRAYVIADNRLAEVADWDNSILKIELQNLILNTDIEIGLTGFEVAEIDLILESDSDQADPDDELPPEAEQIISQPGYLWHLGNHRILCGDSREDSNLATLMQNQRAAIVFVDPPTTFP